MSIVSSLSKNRTMRPKKALLPFKPDYVYVDREVADHPTTLRILNRLSDVEVDIVDDVKRLKRPHDLADAKRQMILTAHMGQAFKPCQGMSEGHLCCGYKVLDLVSGCPMECSYCILQDYLSNNPVTTVFVNLDAILAQVTAFLNSHKDRFFRIGTGELADSLALDPIIDYASVLIPYFASKRNAILELKTKTSFVDHLLHLKHHNRTVIAWSLNTPSIIESEERGTATLDERFEAAQKAAQAGFGVAFHFDPLILSGSLPQDVAQYSTVIDRMLDEVPVNSIAWVSLGLLRYPPSLPGHAAKNFPQSRIFAGELVPVGSKVRYPRFIREEFYKPLWEKLCNKLPQRKVYLCMETPSVWKKLDSNVTQSSCIEKRLCNMESI
ncbi:MAG: radical SAM protein [Pseudomonadota bacterium]